MDYCSAMKEVAGLWDWNLETNRVHFSPRWSALLGYADGDVKNRPEEWLDRIHPDERRAVLEAIAQVRQGTTRGLDLPHRLRHKDGTYRWMSCRGTVTPGPDGRALRLHGAHDDVTAATVTDPLTGLPNGLLLLDHLRRAIEQTQRQPGFLFALTIVDPGVPPDARPADSPGDNPLIQAAARRLETSVGHALADTTGARVDLVARVDDDQFAVLVVGLESVAQAKTGADRILADLLAPLSVAGAQCFLSPRVGVAVSATGYTLPEHVLRDAGIAAQRARMVGGSACELFDTALLPAERVERQLARELREALERDEFRVHYQPIVRLLTDRIVGAEALVRWQHPSRGLLQPADFVPFAEKAGIIPALGRWVLREACRQLGTWRRTLPEARDLWVSVNVSSLQLEQANLVAEVSQALADASVEPDGLALELTEGLAVADSQAARTVLMQLRALGVRISLDDFGTGYSSLGYIRQLPIDTVKIDRSFVRDIESGGGTADLVSTIMTMARQLGLETVAEGVENEAQLGVLRQVGCGSVQGYLVAKPLAADEATELLRVGLAPRHTAAAVVSGADRPVLSAASAGSEGAPRIRAVWAAVLAVAVLSLTGGVLTLNSVTPAPVSPTEPILPASPSTERPASAVNGSRGAMPAANRGAPSPATMTSPVAPTRTAAPAAARVAEPAAVRVAGPKEPQPVLVEVVHLHVFGGCRGRLRLSAAGLTYTPTDPSSKDGFTLAAGSLTPSLQDDTLTIKTPSRTYRFKSSVKGDRESIRDFAAAMSRVR
jgi:PAS domain S-box-containing protein